METIKKLLFVFIILEIIFSITLVYTSYSESKVCAPGFDCAGVQNSPYAYFLGIKLSLLGAISFPLLLILFLLSLKYKYLQRFYLAAVILGTVGAVYFLAIQAFILKAFCSTCVAVDSLMIVILIFTLYDLKKNKHKKV
ncbi:MAG: vitamin K epoxide reductase family protein [Nanoarchaeota archaeon]|nr:vitamin K epoxide reductase family protein [Nanoarchaeota archaeon]